MLTISRTDSNNGDFIALVRDLDHYLSEQDGPEHAFYAQFNKIEALKYVLVAYHQGLAVGCGAIKPFDDASMEVKRMYVKPEFRGQKIASRLLTALEDWAFELDMTRCILETGKRQPEAIALYEKSGYQRFPNYGQYEGVENSVCFEKTLRV
jgi:GNAT superfamily N-acetyltransferase